MLSGVPMCMGCLHFDPTTPELACSAFPDGIPLAVIMNSVDHRFPMVGDNGIQYVSTGGKSYGLAVSPKVQPTP
jgi:hypothetical protein